MNSPRECPQSGPPHFQVNIPGILGSYKWASINLQLLHLQSCNQKISNVVNSQRGPQIISSMKLSGVSCWTIATISGNDLFTIHPEKSNLFWCLTLHWKKMRSYVCHIYFWVTKKDLLPKNISHTSLLTFCLQTFVWVKYNPPGIPNSRE